MKATIEISEETMDRISELLNIAPLYEDDGDVDEYSLEDAIKTLVDVL